MKLGIIGCGKMGLALLQGALKNGVIQAADVLGYDVYAPSLDGAVEKFGIGKCSDNEDVVRNSDVVLLCVKPYGIRDLATEVSSVAGGKLFISIAAGVKLGVIESHIGDGARVVRVMPNTPALVGKGAAAYTLGSKATGDDAKCVEELLGAVGMVTQVPEKLIDAVTGLSGSGPAYVYLIIEALADGGLLMGLTKQQSIELAAQTVSGAAEMVLQTGQHPALLRDQVTSPGGTTIAALAVLEERGVRSALIEAVRCAAEKAVELGE